MLGRAEGSLPEHISPNLSTITTCDSSKLPLIRQSTTSTTFPSLNFTQTQSTKTISSIRAFVSIGLRPHTTSNKNAPNAYTSDFVVAFPVFVSSGAMYPNVPTTLRDPSDKRKEESWVWTRMILFLGIVSEKGCSGGFIGHQAVEVNPDMVIINIPELEILDSVELHSEEMVREVSDIGGVEQAEILAGKSRGEIHGLRNREGEAMAT
nr:hypothetical protein PRUPE_6G260100 [Ipomoea batatas]